MKSKYYKEKIEFFNERASVWNDLFYLEETTGKYTRNASKFERLFKEISLNEGDIVLDVGCGAGILVEPVFKAIGENGILYELDFAEKMIEENRKLHSDRRINFLAQDLLDVDFPEESIDCVICFSCFPHFDDKPAALRVIDKILKPGGKFVIAHFSPIKEINSHHKKHPQVMHDFLPENPQLIKMIENQDLKLKKIVEDDQFYLVIALK